MRNLLFILLFTVTSLTHVVMSQSKSSFMEEEKIAYAMSDATQEQVKTDSEKVSISVYDNQLYITNATENSIVEVKNMLGETILTFRINSSREAFNLNLKKGFYIIRVDEILQRIIIK